MPDPPLWSNESDLGIVLLSICTICFFTIVVLAFFRNKESILRVINISFWLPILSIIVLLAKRISYELWVFHYYGLSGFDPVTVGKDWALLIGNVAFFLLILFFMVFLKFLLSAFKETNKPAHDNP